MYKNDCNILQGFFLCRLQSGFGQVLNIFPSRGPSSFTQICLLKGKGQPYRNVCLWALYFISPVSFLFVSSPQKCLKAFIPYGPSVWIWWQCTSFSALSHLFPPSSCPRSRHECAAQCSAKRPLLAFIRVLQKKSKLQSKTECKLNSEQRLF